MYESKCPMSLTTPTSSGLKYRLPLYINRRKEYFVTFKKIGKKFDKIPERRKREEGEKGRGGEVAG